MSLKKFRLIDLSRLRSIALLVEVITAVVFRFTKLPRFYISVTAAVTRIARIRWNAYGLLIGPVTGLLGQIIRSVLRNEYSIYGFFATTLPYLLLGVCLLFFKKEGLKEKRRRNYGYLVLYALSGYFALEAGKLLCEIGNLDYYQSISIQMGADVIQVLVGLIVLLAAFLQKTILMDRKERIREREKKNQTAQRREAKFDYYKLEERAEGNDVNDAALLAGGTLSSEDLKKREAERRRIENRQSLFDKENEADKEYYETKKNKGGVKHGS